MGGEFLWSSRVHLNMMTLCTVETSWGDNAGEQTAERSKQDFSLFSGDFLLLRRATAGGTDWRQKLELSLLWLVPACIQRL